MQTRKWKHLVTRRLAVQVAIAWNTAFGSLSKKRYQTGIMDTLVYYDGKKTEYYIDEEQLNLLNEDLDKLLGNPEFVAGLIPEAKEFLEETYAEVKESMQGLGKKTARELKHWYTEFSNVHANYYTRMWMVFRICERIVLRVQKLLEQEGTDSSRIKELVRMFSTPLKPNDVTQERMDLLKIAMQTKEKSYKEINQLLKEHTEKYKHIPMFDFDHEPYTAEHFRSEFDRIENPEKELERIEASFLERKTEFEDALKSLNPKDELYALIIMLKKAVFLRDYRDMIRQKLNLTIKEAYNVMGEKLGLTDAEMALLTNKEIEKHLTEETPFNKEEIQRRKEAFLLIQNENEVTLFTGEDANEKAKAMNLTSKVTHAKTIKGITASPGKTQGRARIVYTNLDFKKIEEGDILVATMTRQDFVQIMRRVKGIITNEGGVTCHAGIIARELGLPCIVGTGVATEVIQDGDIVSIDTEKDTVEIIERK